ncbi:MAG: hypothetical protein GF364_11080 [Candidatus Lokiarchaeota archaeon]|nr:hypothetical protein [Candidatus Lokiarchaeota archaeon]
MESIPYALTMSLIAGLSTIIGGWLGIINKKPSTKFISLMMSISAGVMVFLSFTEMFRDAEDILGMPIALLWLSIGLLVAFLIDKLLPEAENVHEHLYNAENGKLKEQKQILKEIPHSVPFPRGHIKGQGKGLGMRRREGLGRGNKHQGMKKRRRIIRTDDQIIFTDQCGEMFCVSNQKMMKLGLLAILALFIHNIPEGIATFSASLSEPALGLEITIAVAMHNIPEGICVAVPIYLATDDKRKAIGYAAISGLAEPAGALIAAIVLSSILTETTLVAILAWVAGIMIYISVDTLIPTAKNMEYKHTSIIGFSIGMIAMGITLIWV